MNQLSTSARQRRGMPVLAKYLIVCVIAIVLITGSIRGTINLDNRQDVAVEVNNLYGIAEIQIASQYNNIVGDALSVKSIVGSYIDEGGAVSNGRYELVSLFESIIDNTKKYAAIKYVSSIGEVIYAGEPKETEISEFMMEKYQPGEQTKELYAYISSFGYSERTKETTFTITIPMLDSNEEFCGYIIMEPYLEVMLKNVESALDNANISYELLVVEGSDASYIYSDIDKARGIDGVSLSDIKGLTISREVVTSANPSGSFTSDDGESYYYKFEMPVSNFTGDKHEYVSPDAYIFVLTLPTAYFEEVTHMPGNTLILLAVAVSVLSILITLLLYIAQRNRRKFTAKTTKMAQVDTLTGLLNRAYFTELFEGMVEEDPEAKYAILFMDLDGFKDVNDSYGHNMGDKVLRVVANRLVMAARREDLVSRFGGDEFAMLVSYSSVDQVRYIANKIVRAIDEVMVIDENEYHVGVSVGVAIYPDHARTVDDLYKVADNAMYKVKYSTKNAYYISKGDDKVL